MTTDNDDLQNREQIFGQQIYTQGVFPTGFQDPSGVFPRVDYSYQSSINRAARAAKRNDLATNGGIPTLQKTRTGTPEENAAVPLPQYPHNTVWETPGGHIIEMDDTLGNERMMIRHHSGAGIEIKPDGTVYLSSINDMLVSTGNDAHVVVEGNAHMTYQGSLNVDVAGDYNMNVGGNLNQVISGDIVQQVDGGKRTTVEKNYGNTVKGHYSNTINKSKSEIILAGSTQAVKGDMEIACEGSMGVFASGSQRITSETQQNMTSPNTNIHATDLSVFGDVGTFGGENIVLYSYNHHLGNTLWLGDGEGGSGTINVDTIRAVRVEVTGDIVASNSMTSPTFHGDLDGVAEEARQSRHQLYSDPDTGPGSAGNVGAPGAPITNNAIDTDILPDDIKATAIPNAAVATTYQQSSFGIQKVKVDPNNAMSEGLVRSKATGGVADRQLTASEVRSKMRDNNNRNNTDFTATQIAEGKLDAGYSSPNPSKLGRSASSSPSVTENVDNFAQ
jgi:hypothetical protein